MKTIDKIIILGIILIVGGWVLYNYVAPLERQYQNDFAYLLSLSQNEYDI